MAQKRPDEAVTHYRKAVSLRPELFEAHTNLGNALKETGHFKDAAASHRKAIALNPEYAEAHTNLGNAWKELGRLEDAAASHEKAIRLEPDLAEAHSNLGSILDHQDRLEEGEATCRHAIELKPEYSLAHANLAQFLFRKGHLKEAWDEYEWRWRTPEQALSAGAYPQPRWDGSPLKGKSILLWGEQGIGDVIRYAGMIPDVLETGASVSIVCDERVVDIFARSFDGARVSAAPITEAGAEKDSGADGHDFQCPFGSLGKFFRSERGSFPSDDAGYLKADPERLEFWKTRLLEKSRRPKVGLSWSGFLSDPMRDRYYATIEEMAPVLSIGGLDFINLQSHDSSADIEQAKSLYGADIHTWDGLDLRNDLDGVAALTAALDLVISFPTFGAEFAGALGVPTLCFAYNDSHIDFLGTGNSVWQPAIRYVTKTQDEPWRGVLEEIGRITRKRFSL